MVALIVNGEVVLSIIHDFVNDKMYWAIRGEGAYCNDTKISVSNRQLSQSILAFETKLENTYNFAKYMAVGSKANLFQALASGYEFTMIASGKLDGKIAIEPYGMDWDFAPGSLLVTEAGGVAHNIGKNTYNYRIHDYIISNRYVYEELTAGDTSIFPKLSTWLN